jgi:tRNA1(Val) A37 N6-methylase TrmN6
MDLTKYSKIELLMKCQELGITKCKSKNKNKLIEFINKQLNKKINSNQDLTLNNITKCDIFTPDDVSERMSFELLNFGKILEPCVGTGNLLKYINFEKYDKIDIYEIKTHYLNQINDNIKINKFNCDFLKKNIDELYENIILNPPYIKIQDLPVEYREYINSNYELLKGGAIDIYYAFIIKCLKLLNTNGIMISITPNSYLYNKTAYKLRKYLFDNKLIKEIIDFKEKKVFSNVSVYCCITIYNKQPKTHLIYNNEFILYDDIVKNYSLFNFNSSVNTLKNICKIKNGIATLRDKIFIHEMKLFDEPCWKQITNGTHTKYIIYPYENGNIISEDIFKTINSLTYQYLLDNKEELSKRDNGNKSYPIWYAYGRSQSIKYTNKRCIYIPCFIEPNTIPINLFENKNILHYGCLCLEPNNDNDIDFIKNIIISNINFIKNNSSKRSAGWINLTSSVLYNLPLQL